MSHGDRVTSAARVYRHRHSGQRAIAMIADDKRKFYATQFHLEVVHTRTAPPSCATSCATSRACAGDWTMRAFKDEAIEKIHRQVGGSRVICGLSAASIPLSPRSDPRSDRDQLTCVFVATGLCGLAKPRRFLGAVPRRLQHSADPCDAADTFLDALAGVETPKQTQDIGKLFIDVFEARQKSSAARSFWRKARSIPNVIESVSFTGGPSVTIKSHHNVGGLPGA